MLSHDLEERCSAAAKNGIVYETVRNMQTNIPNSITNRIMSKVESVAKYESILNDQMKIGARKRTDVMQYPNSACASDSQKGEKNSRILMTRLLPHSLCAERERL